MKSLSKIMMSDFIEMACGNSAVVLEDGEQATEEEIRNHVHKLITDYKIIVNEVGMKSIFVKKSSECHRAAKWQILKNCLILLSLDGKQEVRDIMGGLGYSVSSLSDDAIESKIASEMRRIEFEQKRLDEFDDEQPKATDEEQTRASFDQELASMMIFYKMHIDVRSMTASVYAHMVSQAIKDMKVAKNAVRNMKS